MSASAGNSSFLRLIFCSIGIYGFFLTWGVLQERIATMEYINGELKGRFKYFQVLNMIQAFLAATLAFLQIRAMRMPLCGTAEHPHPPSSNLLFSFLKIAVSSSVASSLGYRSLRHINFPTMILGKSCKLVPVMLMNFLIYRKKFESYKYFTVALITAGVSGFMLFEHADPSASKSSNNSLFGLGLLLCNLLLDGATNSWQDQLFLKYRLRSQQLMMFMNLFSGLLLAASLIFYTAINPSTSQLIAAYNFVRSHPDVIPDILAFSLCGALGQLFIFYTLQHFGSLVLVTITVTRKLFTILLSLFWFNHQVNGNQWTCVGLVFVALILESFIGSKYKTKTVKVKVDEDQDQDNQLKKEKKDSYIEEGKFIILDESNSLKNKKIRNRSTETEIKKK